MERARFHAAPQVMHFTVDPDLESPFNGGVGEDQSGPLADLFEIAGNGPAGLRNSRFINKRYEFRTKMTERSMVLHAGRIATVLPCYSPSKNGWVSKADVESARVLSRD